MKQYNPSKVVNTASLLKIMPLSNHILLKSANQINPNLIQQSKVNQHNIQISSNLVVNQKYKQNPHKLMSQQLYFFEEFDDLFWQNNMNQQFLNPTEDKIQLKINMAKIYNYSLGKVKAALINLSSFQQSSHFLNSEMKQFGLVQLLNKISDSDPFYFAIYDTHSEDFMEKQDLLVELIICRQQIISDDVSNLLFNFGVYITYLKHAVFKSMQEKFADYRQFETHFQTQVKIPNCSFNFAQTQFEDLELFIMKHSKCYIIKEPSFIPIQFTSSIKKINIIPIENQLDNHDVSYTNPNKQVKLWTRNQVTSESKFRKAPIESLNYQVKFQQTKASSNIKLSIMNEYKLRCQKINLNYEEEPRERRRPKTQPKTQFVVTEDLDELERIPQAKPQSKQFKNRKNLVNLKLFKTMYSRKHHPLDGILN